MKGFMENTFLIVNSSHLLCCCQWSFESKGEINGPYRSSKGLQIIEQFLIAYECLNTNCQNKAITLCLANHNRFTVTLSRVGHIFFKLLQLLMLVWCRSCNQVTQRVILGFQQY